MAETVLQELGVNSGGRIVFDRSRVRILLCDPSSSPDVVDLLRRCSYQVMVVQNARQVMEVLRNRMAQIDLILADVELPNKRGFKMLKHIMKEEQLKQIPIVMMSSRDDMSVVGKCLRLGAADYLVKPLRTNELLNLWTHMWRRRRMLGLTEKHLISGTNEPYFDVLFCDTSESNTTSTDLFSDESNDQARRSVMDGANSRLISSSAQARRDVMDGANDKLANLSSLPGLELSLKRSSDLVVPEIEDTISAKETGPSPPKKTELKIGESSAFLSYTKFCSRGPVRIIETQPRLSQSGNGHEHQSIPQQRIERPPEWQSRPLPQGSDARDHSPMEQRHAAARGIPSLELSMERPTSRRETVDSTMRGSNPIAGLGAESLPLSHGVGWNAGEQMRTRFPQLPVEQLPMMQMHVQNESLMGVPTIPPFPPPHHIPHSMVPPNIHPSALLPPPLHLYHGLEGPLGLMPVIPPMHSLPLGHGMAPTSFSYYPLALPMGHPAQLWPSMPAMPISERKLERAERREAALSKFRQKRKDRCFEKKIRYVSRKRLAEQRPRNRGQFVRRSNGSELGGGAVVDESEEEEEEENVSADGSGRFSFSRGPVSSRRT